MSVSLLPANDFVEQLASERRTTFRYRCYLDASCQAVVGLEGGSRWPGVATDISSGGIALVLSRRFEPGTILAIGLQGPGDRSGCMPLAHVQRIRPHGAYWLMGCSWCDEISVEELRALLGTILSRKEEELPMHNRRQEARRLPILRRLDIRRKLAIASAQSRVETEATPVP